MQAKNSFDFIYRMVHVGISLGCIIGSVSGVLLLWVVFQQNTNAPIILTGLLGLLVGGNLGILYGIFAGFTSGLLMMYVTRSHFQVPYHRTVYKIVMAGVTAGATALILIIAPFWIVFGEAGLIVFLMALVFSAYASQRIANDYIHEADVRKPKSHVN